MDPEPVYKALTSCSPDCATWTAALQSHATTPETDLKERLAVLEGHPVLQDPGRVSLGRFRSLGRPAGLIIDAPERHF